MLESEDQYAQEFECSFDAAVIGAYYGRLMRKAKEHKRISNVPHEPSLPVWTAWDLGIADATAIWFAQVVGREIRIIDYYESSGVELAHYVRELQKRDYLYAGHFVPHDAQAKELGTGKSRIELMQSLGLRSITLAPSHFVEDGIDPAVYGGDEAFAKLIDTTLADPRGWAGDGKISLQRIDSGAPAMRSFTPSPFRQ